MDRKPPGLNPWICASGWSTVGVAFSDAA